MDVTGEAEFGSSVRLPFAHTTTKGAGNSFLGGLAAGLELSGGDVQEGGQSLIFKGSFSHR